MAHDLEKKMDFPDVCAHSWSHAELGITLSEAGEMDRAQRKVTGDLPSPALNSSLSNAPWVVISDLPEGGKEL